MYPRSFLVSANPTGSTLHSHVKTLGLGSTTRHLGKDEPSSQYSIPINPVMDSHKSNMIFWNLNILLKGFPCLISAWVKNSPVISYFRNTAHIYNSMQTFNIVCVLQYAF